MKTTVEISDPLFHQARQLAAREGTTLRAVVELSLRRFIDEKAASKPFKLRDGSFRGEFSPEFTGSRWETIRDAVYEGRGG